MAGFLKRYWIFLVLGLIIVVGAVFTILFLTANKSARSTQPSETPTRQDSSKIQVLYEEIPGSRNHSPDGTWWGYNMTKIARFGDTVYLQVIDNDDDPATPSKFTIYKKEGDGPWEKGAALPTSRPGNILVDSTGMLHAFVFEPVDIAENDSRGRLVHYYFPDSKGGDITNFEKEIAVDQTGESEIVNIRIGAAIGADDTMLLSWGGAVEGKGNVERVYYKRVGEAKWNHEIAGANLGHDWYYPFALVGSAGSFHLLPVQDDFVATDEPNIYQKIMYFEKVGGKWRQEMIADLSKHKLASSRRRLLEQSDLFEDSRGNIHIIYKENLDPGVASVTSAFKHLTKRGGKWETTSLDLRGENINWLQLVGVDGALYYIATSYDELFIGKVGSSGLTRIETPRSVTRSVKGIYPYVAQPKTGTREAEKFVDILLLAGDGMAYPNATNAYVRIPKSEFSKID